MKAIDMHAHLAVPAVAEFVAESRGWLAAQQRESAAMGESSMRYNAAHIADLGAALTVVDSRLSAMDAAGVDVQAVSALPIPHAWADAELAQRIVADTNSAIAEHCACAPQRLIGIAAVSLQYPELAAEQLRRAVTDFGLHGVQISTQAAEGRELDHLSLEPFWAAAVELGVPVLIHPWGCTLGARLDVGYLFNTVGNPTETTVALSRLIFGGVLDRHPSLRIWAAHGGGFLPSYTGRIDHAWRTRSDARTCQQEPSAYLRRMWFDALVYTSAGLRHLIDSVGVSQVTLGSDYPFDMGVADPIERVRGIGLGPGELSMVCEVNALRLLGSRTALGLA